MNRRAFFKLSWGTVGVGALVSALGVSFAAILRLLGPHGFGDRSRPTDSTDSPYVG